MKLIRESFVFWASGPEAGTIFAAIACSSGQKFPVQCINWKTFVFAVAVQANTTEHYLNMSTTTRGGIIIWRWVDGRELSLRISVRSRI